MKLLHRRKRALRRELVQQRRRLGSLHGNQPRLLGEIAESDIAATGYALPKPGDVFVDVGGVDDDNNALGCVAIDDAVIDDATVGITDYGVARLAKRQLAHIVCHQPLDGIKGTWTDKLDLAHVTHVKQANGSAYGLMLVEDRRIRHRHRPATKVDDARRQRYVTVVQSSPLGRCPGAVSISSRTR